MKKKSFVYSSVSLPNLKRNIVWLAFFGILMIGVMIYQGIIMINASKQGINLTLLETIAGIGCLVIALVFVLLQVANISKNIAYIKKIKANGSFEVNSFKFNFADKDSFGYFCRIFEYIMLLITTFFAIAVITYSIYNYIFSNTINYYLPIVLMLLVCNNYSCKMVEHMYELQHGEG